MLQAGVGWRNWAKTLVGICAQTSAIRIKNLLNSFKTPMPTLSNVKSLEKFRPVGSGVHRLRLGVILNETRDCQLDIEWPSAGREHLMSRYGAAMLG